ncbi:hypothetical protein lerEdw1_009551, partial [Lerista edwardsae]
MRTLLSLCLCLALFQSVASLECYSCVHLGKTCRHPNVETCASDEGTCITSVAQGSLGAFSMTMSVMSCAKSQYCTSGYYSASVTDSLHTHMKIYCCQTDKCNNVSITLPEDKQRTHNGMKCPSCFSFFKDHCEARNKVNCLHEEDHCFYYGGIIKNGEPCTISQQQGLWGNPTQHGDS